MSASKHSESKFALLFVIIILIHEKPLSATASDCGTNKYNKSSFLIFGKATSITELPSKSSTVSGECFFSLITCNSLSILSLFFVICIFWPLLILDKTRFFCNPEISSTNPRLRVHT